MPAHLHAEIEKLKKRLLALSAIVEESVYLAVKALEERNAELAQTIINGDEEIDQREVDIEEECLKLLALHQPVANDLRFIITVLKINAELERIGDSTVNIAERVWDLVQQPPVRRSLNFADMAQKAKTMLHNSLDALILLDLNLAYHVIEADDEVDTINRQMYAQVEQEIMKDPDRVNSLIHLLGISRHIERIGDHASNIAEDVIYLIEGKIVRHRTENMPRA